MEFNYCIFFHENTGLSLDIGNIIARDCDLRS